jgi:ribosomal protein S18 acetylase RimI-like enzyme
MATTVLVRRATADDNVLLAELGRQTFYETFARDNTPEDMAAYLASAFGPAIQAAELADPDTLFLLVEDHTQAVGYARLRNNRVIPGITGTRPLEIARFYARREWLGRGVGNALMRACLDAARAGGADQIWLDVWEHNARARAFYHKWDFVEVGKQTFQLGGDLQNDLILARPVDDPTRA